jgi:ketoreductase RED2
MVREFVKAQAPLQRPATSEDVAHVILALVTARYVTGEVVLVDGGLHLR